MMPDETDPLIPQERMTIGAALRALARTTGIEGQVIQAKHLLPNGKTADAQIEIQVDQHTHLFVVEIKAVDRQIALQQTKNHLLAYEEPGLLVARHITPELANRCRTLDLHFIDTAGNAYLRAPGLYIYVTGQRRNDIEQAPRGFRAFNATGLRVIFALLCQPKLVNEPYRQIAKAAGVALGTTGWVFRDLINHGMMIEGGTKYGRRIQNMRKVLEEWVTNYPARLRPKLGGRRYRAPEPDWWKRADIKKYNAWWGGEIAADRLTGYLKPQTATVYVQGDARQIILDHRLRPDINGDVEILNAFWHFENEDTLKDLAPPLLVYADLIATGDPRNTETARLINEKYLIDAQG